MKILVSLSQLKECLVSRQSLFDFMISIFDSALYFRLHSFAENKNYFGNAQNTIQETSFLEIKKSCVSFQTIDHLRAHCLTGKWTEHQALEKTACRESTR